MFDVDLAYSHASCKIVFAAALFQLLTSALPIKLFDKSVAICVRKFIHPVNKIS